MQSGSPRPGDSLTPAFSGPSCSQAPALKTKQRSRNLRPTTPRGAGPKPQGFRPAAPGPARSGRGAQGGRLPCPLRAVGRRSEFGPSSREAATGSLPAGDHLAARVWPGPARPGAHLSVPGSRPAVRRSRIPSTHSVFRLPPEAAGARDRKFGRPPTLTPTRSPRAGRRPPRAGGSLRRARRAGTRLSEQGWTPAPGTRAAVSGVLVIPGLGAPRSAKPEKRGQCIPAVTSRLPRSGR